MREILFRGKDYLCNWHYGSLIQEEYLEPNWEDLENPKTQNNYAIRYKNENDWVSGYKNIEVMPHTIGQYTGLTDKNGKKIFEGDIVIAHYFFENFDKGTLGAYEDENEITGKIVFDLDGFRVIDREDECRQLPLSMIQEPVEELEIIGNIWDNPELIEKEE